MATQTFVDRIAAGEALARALEEFRGRDAVVLGLARGGVEVGYAVAKALGLPLRALIVRKLGAPWNPELAIGAVSETGIQWLDERLMREVGAGEGYARQEVEEQLAEANRRKQEYRMTATREAVEGKVAIVVDDGIATGATTLVGVESARTLEASEVVLAAPVASPHALELLAPHVDRLVILATPEPFLAVGMHYHHFAQVSDAEVVRYLTLANEQPET